MACPCTAWYRNRVVIVSLPRIESRAVCIASTNTGLHICGSVAGPKSYVRSFNNHCRYILKHIAVQIGRRANVTMNGFGICGELGGSGVNDDFVPGNGEVGLSAKACVILIIRELSNTLSWLSLPAFYDCVNFNGVSVCRLFFKHGGICLLPPADDSG